MIGEAIRLGYVSSQDKTLDATNTIGYSQEASLRSTLNLIFMSLCSDMFIRDGTAVRVPERVPITGTELICLEAL